MIAAMLLVVSAYVFCRAVQEARRDGGPFAAVWIVAGLVAVFGILSALIGSSPK